MGGTPFATHVERARAAHPDLDVPAEAFASYVRERLPEGDLAPALERMHVADLYLACACVLGVARAHAELDRLLREKVPAYVSRVSSSAAFTSEVAQALRTKLLVGERGAPKIAEYTGRGALGAWLRVVAVRTALNMRRGAGPRDAEPSEDLRAPGPDPELAFLKEQHREVFRAALRATLAAMPPEERTMLRLHHIDGLTLDQLASMYKTPRSTVARRIAHVRSAILHETRRALEALSPAEPIELESILRGIGSRLDVSLVRYLA